MALQVALAAVSLAVVLAMGTSVLAARSESRTAATPAAPATGASAPRARSPVASATRASAALPPQVGIGRTDLGGGMYVERTANEVVVHFDTPVFRTRRPEKFEQVVRATLPEVYGARAQRVLDAIPDGSLLRGGNLLTELPARGVALPVHEGIAITIHPGTRPGQDGPLAVRYRVIATAAR